MDSHGEIIFIQSLKNQKCLNFSSVRISKNRDFAKPTNKICDKTIMELYGQKSPIFYFESDSSVRVP